MSRTEPLEIRIAPRELVDRTGLSGRWRFRCFGERIAVGDYTDFPTEDEIREGVRVSQPGEFRGVLPSEAGYTIMPDEERDVITPFPAVEYDPTTEHHWGQR